MKILQDRILKDGKVLPGNIIKVDGFLNHRVDISLLKDIADFGAMNAVYAEFFTGDYPARAAFQVAALPKDALVEIEAVAAE